MKCKFCFAEVEDDVTICPLCGKDLTEEEVEEETEEIVEEEVEDDDDEYEEIVIRRKKKKKKQLPKWLLITLASVGAVALTVGLTAAVLYGMGVKFSSVTAFFGFTEAKLDYKSNYTVSDKKVEAKANVVVATAGDQTLTNEQLQLFYWVAVREFLNQYEEYIYYGGQAEMPFDKTKPLNEQIYDEKTGQTWQQYFIETAVDQWYTYACIVQLAEDAGYVLPQTLQDELNSYSEWMTTAAMQYGYPDVESYIDAEISKGASAAGHYHYFEMQYKALGYLETLDAELAATEAELEAYYAAHEQEFKDGKCSKEDGKYYDVRHIYIAIQDEMPEGGYTDEQWAACLEKAEKLLNEFLADEPTEEKFAALAKERSEDSRSASNGGLYTVTAETNFVQEFKDWYLDESRKPGDTGLVKNTGSAKHGYHIMYFSGSTEIWKDEAETGVLDEKMTKFLDAAAEKYPKKVNYKKVVLGNAELSTQQY